MVEILLVVVIFLMLLGLARLAAIRHWLQTLSRLYTEADPLMEEDGVDLELFFNEPPEVGNEILWVEKMRAIKTYRSTSGRGFKKLKESKEYVEEIQRRWSLNRRTVPALPVVVPRENASNPIRSGPWDP